jgi:hypothetical protein
VLGGLDGFETAVEVGGRATIAMTQQPSQRFVLTRVVLEEDRRPRVAELMRCDRQPNFLVGEGVTEFVAPRLRHHPQLRFRRPARHDLVAGHHLSEELVDVEQRSVVLGLRVGGAAVAGEQHVVVLHERLPRRCLAAHIRGDARDDDALDAVRAQNEIEIGVLEGAVAVLGDDHFVG